MRYIISSFTSSSRSEIEVFYQFIKLIFCLLSSITFLKKILHKTTLVFYSMNGVNNAQLFVMIEINTFFNKSYTPVTSCHKKDAQTLFQLFLKKGELKAVKRGT